MYVCDRCADMLILEAATHTHTCIYTCVRIQLQIYIYICIYIHLDHVSWRLPTSHGSYPMSSTIPNSSPTVLHPLWTRICKLLGCLLQIVAVTVFQLCLSARSTEPTERCQRCDLGDRIWFVPVTPNKHFTHVGVYIYIYIQEFQNAIAVSHISYISNIYIYIYVIY